MKQIETLSIRKISNPARILLPIMAKVLIAYIYLAFTLAPMSGARAESPKIAKDNLFTGSIRAPRMITTNRCDGENLIENYQSNEPDKFARLRGEAARIINGDSIFWRVEKEGSEPSHVLGTMHVADDRITSLDWQRLHAFSNAKTVIVESVDRGKSPQNAAGIHVNLHRNYYMNGTSLLDHIDSASVERLEIAARLHGIPFASIIKMRPRTVAKIIALPVCNVELKMFYKPVLDVMIAQQAQRSGKHLVGLETRDEQNSAVAGLPESFYLENLRETLTIGNKTLLDIRETLTQLYLAGQIGMFVPFTKVVMPKTGASEGYKTFHENLINKRNATMAERALPYLEKGGAFIAVGALHLPGEDGILNRFARAGYTITPLR